MDLKKDDNPKSEEGNQPTGTGGTLEQIQCQRQTNRGTARAEENAKERRERQWMRPFGDVRKRNGTHDKENVRIATYNISGFPKMDTKGSIKFMRMREESKDIDCFGMSELNRNWVKTNAQQSLYQQLKSWWSRHNTAYTWLKDYNWPSEYQQGGTSLSLTTDKITKYGQEKGEDMSGLGRWVWHKVEGHSKTKTAIIQVYRPTRNTQDNGSTFVQQRAASGEHNPIKIFDKDLLEEVDEFIDQGYQIVLMGDFNEPINGDSRLQRELRERGMYDPIQERYGYDNAPNTQVRGSQPIDAIYVSETLTIERGGYDMGHTEISDHRMLWVDIHIDNVLGSDRGDIQRPRMKKLQIQNRVVTKRFNRVLMQQIRNHRLLEKARKLEEDIGDQRYMTEPQKKEYEVIDTQRCRATACAEERCSKLPSDESDFSAELKETLGIAVVWKQIVEKLKANKRIHTRWIIDTKRKLGIDHVHFKIPTTLEEATAESKQAYAKYRQAKQKAPELRSAFLDMLIQQAEDEGDEKKAKHIREIKTREQSRDVHRRIKVVQGKHLTGKGVRFIHKTNNDGTVETIKDKLVMEAEIQKANATKLMAANESPIRQGELREILTDHDYERWEAFIHGDIQLPPDMNKGTKLWLESFQHASIQEEKVEITKDEYIRSWNKVKEHTSCAPGALHYGTFKAIRWCQPAAELHAIMARIPIKTGYTPQRWKRSTDSMLPKKQGEWRPHKLRLTSLLMPDFNHNNKLLGRRAMKWAEEKKLLAPEQYGSRKKLSAEKHALNKRLMLDAMRIEKRPGVICANDAKSCYDRILHFAAFISLRRVGMPYATVVSMLEPIRQMEHNIRTAYGDSELTYGGERWDIDPSGICQGNGAGPAIWALVSSPLFDCLRSEGFGAKFTSAVKKSYYHLAGFAFVDDADTIQTGEPQEETTNLIAAAQKELDLWEELIRATGGGLEGEKSDFAVVNFQWKGGKWRYEKPREDDTMTVRNQDGTREPLTQLQPSEARRTLGIWQAVDGNEKKQTEVLTKKAKTWSRAIARSSITRNEAIIGMKTSLYPSITFGLMATTMNKDQCATVFKPIRQGALPHTGYTKTMPGIMVHGPTKYGGMGVKDLYTLQGIEHIKALLDEADTESPTGRLISQVVEGHIVEVGRSGNILSQPYGKIEDEMTYSWIQDTLRFASEHKIEIQGDLPVLRTWRTQDTMLMDQLHQAQGISITKGDREAFQRCRLYLQAATLSDIADGKGTHILPAAWKCEREWNTLSSKAYKWPYQPKPSKRDIEAWQRTLQAIYDVCPRHYDIASPMGDYYKASRKQAQWFIDRSNDSLYQLDEGRWKRWRPVITRTRNRLYLPTADTSDTIQRRWTIATVIEKRDRGIVEYRGTAPMQSLDTEQHGGEDMIHETRSIEPPSIKKTVEKLPGSLQWAMEHMTLPADDGREIATMIISGRGRCICDGLVKHRLGTSEAHFLDVRDENNFKTQNRTPGSEHDVHSYRSELCGILAAIIMANCIAKRHDITQGTITLGCDNESALWAAFGNGHTRTGEPSFDLIRVIRTEISKSPLTWISRHVKGHQDDIAGAHLDEWALANVEADEAAGQYWNQKYGDGSKHRPTPARMPGEGWRVVINNTAVVSKLEEYIYNHAYHDRCMAYWEHKRRIQPGSQDSIAWDQHQGATKLLPRPRQQWIHKHFCGFEGTNYMMHKRGERTTPTCPNCSEIETHRHIVQCQSNRATVAYRNIERNFESWLKATTSDEMREALMAHLDAYRENTMVEQDENWNTSILRASNNQQSIGPNAFVEGLLATDWEPIQHEYLSEKGSKKNPSRWISELIKRLWDISWDMWDSRNGEVHRTTHTRKEQIIEQLNRDITTQHNRGTENRFLPWMEREFFRKPLDSILQTTEYQKRTWLHIANIYIERDRQRVARNQSVRLMREWIAPGSTGTIEHQRRRIIHRRESDMRAPEGSRRGPTGPTA